MQKKIEEEGGEERKRGGGGERKGEEREEAEEKVEEKEGKEKEKGERRERRNEGIWRMHGICLREAKSSQRSQAYFLLIDIHQNTVTRQFLAHRKQLGD